MNADALRRFSRYTLIGTLTFALDLLLLWILMEFLNAHILVAASLAFFAAVSLNYCINRSFAFKGTERTVWDGYKNFIAIAVVGAISTSMLLWVLVEQTDLHVAIARFVVALVVGIGNYLVNLYFNFRVVGKHL